MWREVFSFQFSVLKEFIHSSEIQKLIYLASGSDFRYLLIGN
jgi:hypothetical protein